MILDNYEELFSDFDPRPYPQRGLSDDFLLEAKKAVRDKEFGVAELNLMLPKKSREENIEIIIKKRLKDHYKKHYNLLKKEQDRIIWKGLSFTVLGIIFMFLAVYIMFALNDETFIVSFMIVLLEPAGWFLFWEGLGLIVFESKEKRSDLKFYESISKAKISFTGY